MQKRVCIETNFEYATHSEYQYCHATVLRHYSAIGMTKSGNGYLQKPLSYHDKEWSSEKHACVSQLTRELRSVPIRTQITRLSLPNVTCHYDNNWIKITEVLLVIVSTFSTRICILPNQRVLTHGMAPLFKPSKICVVCWEIGRVLFQLRILISSPDLISIANIWMWGLKKKSTK